MSDFDGILTSYEKEMDEFRKTLAGKIVEFETYVEQHRDKIVFMKSKNFKFIAKINEVTYSSPKGPILQVEYDEYNRANSIWLVEEESGDFVANEYSISNEKKSEVKYTRTLESFFKRAFENKAYKNVKNAFDQSMQSIETNTSKIRAYNEEVSSFDISSN